MAPKKATRKSTGSIPAGKPLHSARKSQVTASASRTARKAAPPVENDSDEENVIQSAATSSRKRAAPADDTESDEESDSVDVEASLVQQPTSPKKKSKTVAAAAPAAKPSSKTKKTAAPAPARSPSEEEEEESESDEDETAAVVAANSQKGATKTSKASKKPARKSTTVSTEGAESSDDEDLVSSGSGRGANGYTWEIVDIRLKPEDLGNKLTYHPDLRVKLPREGEMKKFHFERDQRIFVLPDPSWLPAQSREVDLVDLPDDKWWSARILDCCKVDQSDQGEGTPFLGLLRVAWDYSPDDALQLINKNIHPSFEKKLTAYRFDEDERIRSDHVDLISIESFAGFADGIETYVDIKGLEIPDAERLRPLAQRKKVSKAVAVTGFEKKAILIKKELAEKRRNKAYKSTSSSQTKSKSKKPTSSSGSAKKRKAEPAPVEKKSSKKSRKSKD